MTGVVSCTAWFWKPSSCLPQELLATEPRLGLNSSSCLQGKHFTNGAPALWVISSRSNRCSQLILFLLPQSWNHVLFTPTPLLRSEKSHYRVQAGLNLVIPPAPSYRHDPPLVARTTFESFPSDLKPFKHEAFKQMNHYTFWMLT